MGMIIFFLITLLTNMQARLLFSLLDGGPHRFWWALANQKAIYG